MHRRIISLVPPADTICPSLGTESKTPNINNDATPELTNINIITPAKNPYVKMFKVEDTTQHDFIDLDTYSRPVGNQDYDQITVVIHEPSSMDDHNYLYGLESANKSPLLKEKSSIGQDVLLYNTNGDRLYKGGQKDNLRHGYGIEYKNTPTNQNYAFYNGNWTRGFKHGKGEFKMYDLESKIFFEILDCVLDKDD